MANMPSGVPGSSRERSDVADLEKQLVQEQIVPIPRNNSWSGTERRVESSPELAASRRLREPGGFRRGFLQAQALNEGVQQAELPSRWTGRLVDTLRVQSFQVESHFYGLDLDEDSKDEPPPAGAGNLSIAFLIFKGNCGCAILYMPRGWMHGGLLLASIAVPLIGFASIWCSLRLLKVRMQTEGYAGYGELMSNAMGVWGRRGTNIFIVLLQSGICCTYFIVACTLLQSTVCPKVGLNILIPCMCLVILPVVAIRKISSLWPLSLLGTLLVVLGVVVVFGLELEGLVETHDRGPLLWMNWRELLVCLGQACFMFEGIGLILPTFDASKKPEDFPWIYTITMTATLSLVCCIGLFGYMAFGQGVQNLVLLDFQPGVLVFGVRLAFMLQVLCSFPLQMLPASRLIEGLFFERISDPPMARKLAKTGFRFLLVICFAAIAYLGASHLDNFVSLIGALCGMPLAFIFPAAAHYILIKEQQWLDLLLMAIGAVLTVLVTAVNIVAFIPK